RRGVLAGEILGRLDLLGTRAVGVRLGDLDFRIALDEEIEDLTEARPVAWERDDVEGTLRPGGLLEILEGAEIGEAGRGGRLRVAFPAPRAAGDDQGGDDADRERCART